MFAALGWGALLLSFFFATMAAGAVDLYYWLNVLERDMATIGGIHLLVWGITYWLLARDRPEPRPGKKTKRIYLPAAPAERTQASQPTDTPPARASDESPGRYQSNPEVGFTPPQG